MVTSSVWFGSKFCLTKKTGSMVGGTLFALKINSGSAEYIRFGNKKSRASIPIGLNFSFANKLIKVRAVSITRGVAKGSVYCGSSKL